MPVYPGAVTWPVVTSRDSTTLPMSKHKEVFKGLVFFSIHPGNQTASRRNGDQLDSPSCVYIENGIAADLNAIDISLRSGRGLTGDKDRLRARCRLIGHRRIDLVERELLPYPSMEEWIIDDTFKIRDSRRQPLRIRDCCAREVAEPLEHEVLRHEHKRRDCDRSGAAE